MLRAFSLSLFALATSATMVFAQAQPPPQGNNPNTQAGNTQQRINDANVNMFGQINKTPWFMDQAMRTQMKINEQQAARLNQSYNQFFNVYNRNIQGMNMANLTDEQRRNWLTANNQFYTDFNRGINDVLSPEQRVRFNQLGYQYRGYGALYDPAVSERLRLSNDQLTQLRRYEADYNTQLATLYKAPDNTNFSTQLGALRNDLNQHIASVLNEQQRGYWQQLVGEPYDWRYEWVKPVPK
jgi:hypothetical protein